MLQLQEEAHQGTFHPTNLPVTNNMTDSQAE
jgi:hypothetical protein